MDKPFDIESATEQLKQYSSTKRARLLRKLAHAALSSIPWVGGFMGAMATYRSEEVQNETDSIQRQWLEEHALKIQELAMTLDSILKRIDSFGERINERVESTDYQNIVRSGFASWDSAATEEKKQLIVQLITNAGVSDLCSDDVVRLFQEWINKYDEIHFKVIGCIFKSPGISRGQIWRQIRGEFPREDSAEADLFKLLIRDLSTGSIIRQHRETDYHGNFVKKTSRRRSGSSTLKSAFDDNDPYELTELGRQFVHYTMEELVPRIGETTKG